MLLLRNNDLYGLSRNKPILKVHKFACLGNSPTFCETYISYQVNICSKIRDIKSSLAHLITIYLAFNGLCQTIFIHASVMVTLTLSLRVSFQE